MKPFTRLIVKQGCDHWKQEFAGKSLQKIAHDLISDKVKYGSYTKCSDYHGVMQIETPYFVILLGTFPCQIKEFNYEY